MDIFISISNTDFGFKYLFLVRQLGCFQCFLVAKSLLLLYFFDVLNPRISSLSPSGAFPHYIKGRFIECPFLFSQYKEESLCNKVLKGAETKAPKAPNPAPFWSLGAKGRNFESLWNRCQK